MVTTPPSPPTRPAPGRSQRWYGRTLDADALFRWARSTYPICTRGSRPAPAPRCTALNGPGGNAHVIRTVLDPDREIDAPFPMTDLHTGAPLSTAATPCSRGPWTSVTDRSRRPQPDDPHTHPSSRPAGHLSADVPKTPGRRPSPPLTEARRCCPAMTCGHRIGHDDPLPCSRQAAPTGCSPDLSGNTG